MASQATATGETHNYYSSTPWAQKSAIRTPPISGSASPPTATNTAHPGTPWSASSATHLSESPNSRSSPQVDFWPFLYPHQASLYQAQLLHYSNLVSPGRGGGLLQSHPSHTPNVAPIQNQPASRSRASSKVSNKDRPVSNRAEKGHGNKAAQNKDKGDQAVIAGREAASSNMPQKKQQQQSHGEPTSHPLPSRSRMSGPKQAAQPHSSSVPSTPQQHARNFAYESREPSPTNHNNHSPRSAYSETNSALPSLRPLPQKTCPFETAQIKFRRRMPYNIGSGPLERADQGKIKSKLSDNEERKLTTDMRELYDRLLPTEKVEGNRTELCVKLEKLFNDEWPGHNIRVHLFGSSGNLLCSDDSDVDICITTPWKELEEVCSIAELLHRKGMERVVCISAAKVPIVKIWDPELGLACDMNVNNTLALENTRMVRTYIEIDPRVRQLAMVVKYWTRRRELNDAAFGGTLSSYTWICMIIAFLQLRDPPVMPALHQRQHLKLPKKGRDSDSSFADDLDRLRGYGDKNKSNLGELLFQFFRFYAHEFDYDKHVLSVHQGRRLSKSEKKWLHNLCVEEPFNTTRNLGNTADEYSFRGLHIELRRAFDLISEAKLDECCEQFAFPKEEPPPPFVRQQNPPRPVIIRSSSQQQSSSRGKSYRGGRHSNNYRTGGSSRRASSSISYDTNTMYLPPQVGMTPHDLAHWYAQQAQPQAGQQLQYPAILYTQSQVYQHMQAQMAAYAQQQRMQGASSQSQQQSQHQGQQPQQQQQGNSSERSRTNSFDNPPLSAPLAGPDWFGMYAYPYHSLYGHTGYTYPPSPATTTTNDPTEYRRSLQRSGLSTETGTSSSGSSLRSQSQPASRSVPTNQQGHQPYSGSAPTANGIAGPRYANGVPVPSLKPEDADYDSVSQRPSSDSPASDDGPGAYVGYYVSDASSPSRAPQPQPQPQPQGAAPGGIAFGDITRSSQGRRRLSTDQLPQTLLDRRIRRASRSPSPLGHSRAFSVGTSPNSSSSTLQPTNNGTTRLAARPLVVNGTGSSALRTSSTPSQRQPSGSATEDLSGANLDNPLQIQGHGFSAHQAGTVDSSSTDTADPLQQFQDPERSTPVIVDGSTASSVPLANSAPTSAVPQIAEEASFRDRIMSQQHMASQATFSQDSNAFPPSIRQMGLSRPPQNGMIAPLDLATSNNRASGSSLGPDAQHLSPINETRSPSPTTSRKPEQLFSKAVRSPTTGSQSESPKSGQFSNHVKKTMIKESKQGAAPSRPATNAISRSTTAGHPLQASQTAVQASSSHPKTNETRENGHVRSAKSESQGTEGGWQKATKGRKKGGDSRNASSGFVSSEQPPQNEAERKGG